MPHPYAQDLPASPDPEQQRKRAKDLLKALRAGAAEAIARFRYSHPRLAHRPDAELAAAAKLSDAQWVVAREYGFASWPRLQAHLAGEAPEIARPFEVELQYYRDRAAGIRSNHRTGEAGSLRLVQRFHPRFAAASEAEIRAAALSQEDAELVVARSHGFDDWDGFAGRIEAMQAGRAEEPFRIAFEAIRGDDRAALAAVLAAHPGLVNARGTNGNRLLMLAISMNRLVLAGDLLDAGADPNLANDKGWGPLHDIAYGGGRGDREARLALLDRLIAAGGLVEAEAYGDGGTPLAVALFWGHGTVAERLAAEVVAPLNLRIAAGLGRMDLIALFFDADGRLRPEAGHHRGFYRPHSGFPEWHMTGRAAGGAGRGADLGRAQRPDRGDGGAAGPRRRHRRCPAQRRRAALGAGVPSRGGGGLADRAGRRCQPARGLGRHRRRHPAAHGGRLGQRPPRRPPAAAARGRPDHPRPDLRQHPARLGRAFRPSGGRGGAAGQKRKPRRSGA